ALAAATGGAGGAGEPVALARYRGGRRVEGGAPAPERWPAWLATEAPAAPEEDETPETEGRSLPWVVLPDGTLTLAAAVPSGGAGSGVLAVYTGDAEDLVRERSRIWIQAGEIGRSHAVRVRGLEVRVEGTEPAEGAVDEEELAAERERARERFFDRDARGDDWTERPLFTWVALAARPVELTTGNPLAEEMGVFLQATPRTVARSLFAPGAELVRGFWVALLAVSFLLLGIYAVAELVAGAMIVGISRAVSRLYGATRRVASGDFSVRIPVRRTDQVGAVQRSFNAMAENLQDLVATAAQKELLEKELQIARQVQQSLIPKDLPGGETVEFSTLFEPSAAIGGDYFDVLRLSDEALAVVVADVSGHGLPTGLRMAMVKAALGVLVTETGEADEILRRLDATVRSGYATGDQRRFFVTAVFARVDFHRGVLELTNAGHPPTYVVRDGTVEEILLPGSPLGGLGTDYGQRTVELRDGDVVVWLSDGLIEAADGHDEPFGYEGIERALAGPADSAAQVRDRLLAAVAAHTGGRPAMDDRTLVVMRYTAGHPAGGKDGS
ncbi:MAG: PP2C family protein-serine/threonine phosphatase, partial [Thermoanaerobaculia bacterium]